MSILCFVVLSAVRAPSSGPTSSDFRGTWRAWGRFSMRVRPPMSVEAAYNMFRAFNFRDSSGFIADCPGALVASICPFGCVGAIVPLEIGENIHLLWDARNASSEWTGWRRWGSIPRSLGAIQESLFIAGVFPRSSCPLSLSGPFRSCTSLAHVLLGLVSRKHG